MHYVPAPATNVVLVCEVASSFDITRLKQSYKELLDWANNSDDPEAAHAFLASKTVRCLEFKHIEETRYV